MYAAVPRAHLLTPPSTSALLCLHRRVTGATAAQVCKRWNAVFYSDSCKDLWRHYWGKFDRRELADEQRMAAGMRLFRRFSHLIERIGFVAEHEGWLQQAAAPHLLAVLASLNPEVLTELTIDMPLVPASVQAVAQFRQLQHLGIAAEQSTADMAGLADVIPQLQSLQQFHLHASSVEDALLAVVCQLPALAGLGLCSTEEPLPDLSPLAALAGSLTSLFLLERESHDDGLLLPQAAAFPKLRKLFVVAAVLQVECDVRMCPAGLPATA